MKQKQDCSLDSTKAAKQMHFGPSGQLYIFFSLVVLTTELPWQGWLQHPVNAEEEQEGRASDLLTPSICVGFLNSLMASFQAKEKSQE